MLLAIGCYTVKLGHVAGSPGKGISILDLDEQSGRLREVAVYDGIRNPSYLSISADGSRLYAPEELGGEPAELFTYALDMGSGQLRLLSRVAQPGAAGCHVTADPDGRFVFVANFTSGDLLCYRLAADGLPQGEPQVVRTAPLPQSEPSRMHCSQVLPGGRDLLVCDAGRDIVATFAIGEEGLSANPVRTFPAPKGSFPRHIALTPSGRTVLLATELAAHLHILGIDGNGLKGGADLNAVPEGWSGNFSGAAVRVHPNGRFAYMSVRGQNSIFGARIDEAGLGLTAIGNWDTGGRIPRDFALVPSGKWLVAANQDSDNLTVFAVDPETGVLTATGESFATGSPVCVLPLA